MCALMGRTIFSPLLVIALAMASAPAEAQNDTPQNDRLEALFEETWAFRLQEDPLRATSVGEHAYGDRLPGVTAEDQRRRAEYYRGVLARLDAIDRDGDGLSASDRINYDMFRRQLADDIQEFEFKGYLLPINADSGFHIGFSRLPSRVPLASVSDYENYIERLKLARRYIGEHIELMREGIRIGMTVPQVVLAGYEVTIESHVVDEAEASVFFAPFESFPTSVPQAERDRLRTAGAAAIMESAVPGYRDFLQFMIEDYVPGARDTIGASELPHGRAYYAYLVGHFMTMDVTSDEVHQIGLEEVARIRREMDDVIEEVGFRRRLRGVSHVLAHRPAVLRRERGGAFERSLLHRQEDGRYAAVAFQNAPQAAVSSRAGSGPHRAEIHGGTLRGRVDRQHRARDVLGQHLQAR